METEKTRREANEREDEDKKKERDREGAGRKQRKAESEASEQGDAVECPAGNCPRGHTPAPHTDASMHDAPPASGDHSPASAARAGRLFRAAGRLMSSVKGAGEWQERCAFLKMCRW